MKKFWKINNFQSWFGWLIFLFSAILIYYPLLNNFFVSDDFHWLSIARDTGLSWRIFLTNYEGNNLGGSYNPLLVLIWKFFYSIFHLKYWAYHLVSIILHATSAFLVYVLAQKIFSILKLSSLKKYSLLSGFLFLFWPVQVEAIAWIAAWPHLWVLPAYILSLIFYFKFKETSRQNNLWLSLLFFIIALLIKEIAISLPFIILVWELALKTKDRKIHRSLNYFLILFGFLLVRYLSVGLLFGYYGAGNLQLKPQVWLGNLAGYFNEFVSLSFLRVIFFKVHYYYLWLIVVLLLLVLIIHFYYLYKRKAKAQFILFLTFVISLGPVLPLGLHRLSFAGERYLYLASVFFVIYLAYLLSKIKFKYHKNILLVIFIIVSLSIINYKSIIWREAGLLSQQIVDSYQNIQTNEEQIFVSIALPDNLSGAEVFRNNLQQALELYYPDNHPQIFPLPVYTQLNLQNKNSHLLNWRSYDSGWLAESVDGSYIVTGKTSIIYNDFYFELWGYNYQNYTSNVIRLIPQESLINLSILIFDQGILKILE